MSIVKDMFTEYASKIRNSNDKYYLVLWDVYHLDQDVDSDSDYTVSVTRDHFEMLDCLVFDSLEEAQSAKTHIENKIADFSNYERETASYEYREKRIVHIADSSPKTKETCFIEILNKKPATYQTCYTKSIKVS